jgi:hypothetical protein
MRVQPRLAAVGSTMALVALKEREGRDESGGWRHWVPTPLEPSQRPV